eukprot:GEMP01114205.1.p1 GENE.GEMP01114205.1~~GEMP01114205.1.p1  ORF type:complete len:131 (+),score=16.63 GEMP01114205.1:49-393(+)
MEAVDSHVHLTNPQKVRYAWMEGLGEQWNKPWTEGDLQAQISACPYNIDSVVFVEVGLVDTKSAIAEAEWVLSTPWNLVKADVVLWPKLHTERDRDGGRNRDRQQKQNRLRERC